MAAKNDKGVGGLEKSLEDLEALVERLESEELPLAEALKEFERGVKLTRECQTTLKEAEQTVEILLKETVDADAEPFEPADDT
ncbi:MAG: exodeoxyribonuclease VII small subunit [Gammaproteobacteria bacterium]|jgi:exodeoxyribonuclease VII small subunit